MRLVEALARGSVRAPRLEVDVRRARRTRAASRRSTPPRARRCSAASSRRPGRRRRSVVFDLDSTLLDNRPRQARILREYGDVHGARGAGRAPRRSLAGLGRAHRDGASGLARSPIDAHFAPFRRLLERALLHQRVLRATIAHRRRGGLRSRAVLATGARVAYVTGRHEEMRAGTVACFGRPASPARTARGRAAHEAGARGARRRLQVSHLRRR